jgi:hypothetical protein
MLTPQLVDLLAPPKNEFEEFEDFERMDVGLPVIAKCTFTQT